MFVAEPIDTSLWVFLVGTDLREGQHLNFFFFFFTTFVLSFLRNGVFFYDECSDGIQEDDGSSWGIPMGVC